MNQNDINDGFVNDVFSNESGVNTTVKPNSAAIKLIAFLPLIGVFCERMFAQNVYIAVFIWLTIYIASIVVAIYDEKELDSLGASSQGLKLSSKFLPIAYVAIKQISIVKKPFWFFASALALIFALYTSMITFSLTANAESFASVVANDYFDYNYTESEKINTEVLKNYHSTTDSEIEIKWECETTGEKNGYKVTATFSDKDAKSTTIYVFDVLWDGFLYTGADLIEIVKDDKPLDKDDFLKTYNEICDASDIELSPENTEKKAEDLTN